MKPSGLLIRVPGYPTQLQALLPDKTLATVGGYLKDAHIPFRILDYGRPEFLAGAVSDALQPVVNSLTDRFLYAGQDNNPFATFHALWSVHSTDRAFRRTLGGKLKQIAMEIAQESWDFALFSIQDDDDVEAFLILVGYLRELCPHRKLAAIGRYATLYGDLLLKSNSEIDAVFRGDGEAFVSIWAENLQHIYDWTEIPNLTFRENGRVRRTRSEMIDLTNFPLPVYDPTHYEALRAPHQKLWLFEIEESRGCPLVCYGYARISAERWMRPRPSRLITEEIRQLTSLFGYPCFIFSDLTASGTSHAASVAVMLLRQGLTHLWGRRVHVCAPATDVLETLYASGCRVITFDVGSGSQRLLEDCFGKSTGVSKIEEMIANAKKIGIYTILELTYPMPADDYHTREETLRLVSRTRPDAAIVMLPSVHPRTVWFSHADRFGFWFSRRYLEQPWSENRTRFPLPPNRWKSLPYRIGSLAASQVTHLQENLIHAIQRLGIPTHVGMCYALLAKFMSADPVEFTDRVTRILYSGDLEMIQKFLAEINAAVSRTKVADAGPRGLRPAVGDV